MEINTMDEMCDLICGQEVYECSDCGCEVHENDIFHCGSCGEYLCIECFAVGDELCSECFGSNLNSEEHTAYDNVDCDEC